jgi:hypothetical protein
MTLLARLWRAAFSYEAWNFGVASVDLDRLLATGRLGEIRWAQLGGLFGLRADPVLWDCDGELRVLYEELNHYRGFADIRSVGVASLGAGERPRAELAPAFHVSYPLIVRVGGDICCTLESAIDRGVDLYRWDRAARRWTSPQRILDGVPLLDPTLVEHAGRWFLFGTRLDGDGDRELWIWHAAAPSGPWTPQASSPFIVADGTARSAGAFIEHAGTLYRPSQVSAGGYGSALSLKRVTRLDESGYGETEQCRLQADPGSPWPEGLHTLSVRDGLAAIDGKRRAWHPLAWLSKISWRLRGAHPARLRAAA